MSILLTIVNYLLLFFQLLILARVLLSWFPNVDPYNPIIRAIYDMTEPVLRPIRSALPQTGMIDFSPLILLVIIYLLRSFLRF